MRVLETSATKKLTAPEIKALESLIAKANLAYHETGKPLMSDDKFEALVDKLREASPSSKVLKKVGAAVRGKDSKVVLKYFLGSLNKVKADNQGFERWSASRRHKGEYLIADKLDGVSLLLDYEPNKKPIANTRGDGTVGRDVSSIVPFIDDIPATLRKQLVVRGEVVMPKSTFAKHYDEEDENARNIVAGAVNSAKPHPAFKHVHFVAYTVIKPKLSPSEGMALLKSLGFRCAPHKIVSELSSDRLSKALANRREKSVYDIDGLVVTEDKRTDHPEGNPEHAVAFKENRFVEAKVVAVHWKASRFGALKPRIEIEPQRVSGVTITFITGHNASVIYEGKIGPGAIIKITRSGEVIPKLEEVIKPARKASMPDVAWEWDDNGVEAMLKNKSASSEVGARLISDFFVAMGAEFIGRGVVDKLYEAGYNTIGKVLNITPPKLMKIEGFQSVSAGKVYKSIQGACASADLATWMAASGIFGRGMGRRVIQPVIDAAGNEAILAKTTNNLAKIGNVLESTPGIGPSRSQAITTQLPVFRAWFHTLPADLTANAFKYKSKKLLKGPLLGKNIVCTGFRDANLMAKAASLGAKEGTSVNKDSILVAKTADASSAKAVRAKQVGAKVMTLAQFTRYLASL